MEIKDARSLPSIAQEDLRQKAIKAVMDGKKQVEIAEILNVTRQAVGKWVSKYRTEGEESLKTKRKGRPEGGKLLPWQAAQIANTLIDRHPEQMKLPFYLWTREAVAQLIEQRFGIQLSVWTVGRYLARWGFTPQKPVRRAYEQNPEVVQNWLEKDYPMLQQQAKKEKAMIYWGDEMGLRSDYAIGISAINNKGHLNFMVFKSHFDTEVFLGFLKRMVRQIKRTVFLIVDGHPVHHAVKVKNWIHEHTDQIRLFYLPGYSPELNPDEMLNQDVKSNAVGRRRAKNQGELIANTRSYLRSRQKQPMIVKHYFQEEHVRYAGM